MMNLIKPLPPMQQVGQTLQFEGVVAGMRFKEVIPLAVVAKNVVSGNQIRGVHIRAMDTLPPADDVLILQQSWIDMCRWMQSASGYSLNVDWGLYAINAPWSWEEMHDIAIDPTRYSGGPLQKLNDWLVVAHPEWHWSTRGGNTAVFLADGFGFFAGAYEREAILGDPVSLIPYFLNPRYRLPGSTSLAHRAFQREGKDPELEWWLLSLAAEAGIIHEIGHAAFSMPHTDGPPNVMNAPWEFRIDAIMGAAFMEEDVVRVSKSPYVIGSHARTIYQQPVDLTGPEHDIFMRLSKRLTGKTRVQQTAIIPGLYRVARRLPFF